jgi:cyclopropane-fatty-acyl-phospholipid synthase
MQSKSLNAESTQKVGLRVLKHYDQESSVFESFLGSTMKYSSGYFSQGNETLDQAAMQMFAKISLFSSFSNSSRVLEIGCGWGSLSNYLSSRFKGLQFTGITPSKKQVEFIGLRNRSGAKILQGTLQELFPSFIPESYDVIVLLGSLCHLEHKSDSLAMLSSLLAPSGKIIIEDTFFVSDELFNRHKDHPATQFVQSDIFGFAKIDSLATFYNQLSDNSLKVKNAFENSSCYKKTIDIWMENIDQIDPKNFPQKDGFVQYMRIANKGWNKTILNYLFEIEKI